MKNGAWKKEFLARGLEEKSRPLYSMDQILSSRLTDVVRDTFPDDYNSLLVLVRKKTVDIAEVEDCAYGVNEKAVEMGSQRFGSLLHNILVDDKLHEVFGTTIKMILDHEHGHFQPDKYNQPKSEYCAQKYAMKHSVDPISAIAGIVAIDEFICPIGIEKRLGQYIDHWREHWDNKHDFNRYMLPRSKAHVKNDQKKLIAETAKLYRSLLENRFGKDWGEKYDKPSVYPDLDVWRRPRP